MLEIGFGVTDITPRERRQTIYHRTGNPPDDRVPIRDRLFARATAFRRGGRLAVWTTLDICLIGATLREQVIAGLARQGIRPEHVIERVPEVWILSGRIHEIRGHRTRKLHYCDGKDERYHSSGIHPKRDVS